MAKQCSAYLSSISVNNKDSTQKMGTVRCSIVYGCSIDADDNLLPWKEGGIDVMVRLPHNGLDGIKNPLYSPTVAMYLCTTWMNKIPFWSHAIIDLIEIAKDMQIDDSNQFSEGVFKNLKHNLNAYEHTSEPADYVLHRHGDILQCNKQFIHQYQTVYGKIEELQNRRTKKRNRSQEKTASLPASAPDHAAKTTEVDLTQDVITQLAEEEAGEVWSQAGSDSAVEADLRNNLNVIFREKEEIIGGTSVLKQHAFVKSILGLEKKKVMSYSTFNNFMNGNRQSQNGLNVTHRQQLQDFIRAASREEAPEPASLDTIGV